MPLFDLFKSEPFKTCNMCNKTWGTRDKFLKDLSVVYKGYQADFDKLEDGVFLFVHDTPDCKNTLALKAGLFFDLYSGERFTHNMLGAPECGAYCLDRESTASCSVKCECAFIRDVIQVLNNRKRI